MDQSDSVVSCGAVSIANAAGKTAFTGDRHGTAPLPGMLQCSIKSNSGKGSAPQCSAMATASGRPLAQAQDAGSSRLHK